MISQPLQEGEVFLGGRKANVELVNSVPIRLIWKRRFELLSELVRPSDMDPSGISVHQASLAPTDALYAGRNGQPENR